MHVTLEQARIALAAAQQKTVEIDTRMCIAVVDSGANLKAFVRTDDAGSAGRHRHEEGQDRLFLRDADRADRPAVTTGRSRAVLTVVIGVPDSQTSVMRRRAALFATDALDA